jgi:hypothetical protein
VFLHGCPDLDVAPIPVYQALLVAIPGLDITSSTPHSALNPRFAATSRPQGSTLFLAFIVSSVWGEHRLVDGLQVVKWPMPYIDQRPNHAGRHIRTRVEPAADRLHACLDRISDGANLDDPVIRSSATARKRQFPRCNRLFEKAV